MFIESSGDVKGVSTATKNPGLFGVIETSGVKSNLNGMILEVAKV